MIYKIINIYFLFICSFIKVKLIQILENVKILEKMEKMNYIFSGKPTIEDHLKMVQRLSNRTTFLFLIGGLIIGEVIFTFFKWSVLLLIIFAVFYVLIVVLNYFVFVPYRIRKKYKENSSINQKRCFSFGDDIEIEFPIYKVVYYDDAVYIISENNQAMIVKREWLESGKSWEEFIHFIDHKVVPKITPKIYRR